MAFTGLSNRRNSMSAGKEAASMALGSLESSDYGFCLVFATANYNQIDLLKGIREVIGEMPLSGCSGEGVVTQEGSDEGSHVVSVMLFPKSLNLKLSHFCVEGLAEDPLAAGRELAQQIAQSPDCSQGKVLLLMPDGFTSDCAKLIDGLEGTLKPHFPIVGGSAGDSLQFQNAYQYHNDKVISNGVSAVLISGDGHVDIAVSHGCEPIGLVRTITEAEGNRVLKIDGQPAVEVFRQYAQSEDGRLDGVSSTMLAVGHRPSEEEIRQTYGEYIICAPMKFDEETGCVILSRALPVGSKIQMHRRDPDKIATRTRKTAEQVRERNEGKKLKAVIHFECAARGRVIFADRTDEVTIRPLQEVLGKDIPWIGFHCYGEIAPLIKKTHFHNYTVVLCAIYE